MKAFLIVLLFATSVSAQALPVQPVVGWADDLSYATAMVNPGVAAFKAIKHKDWCKLGRLGVSELVGNGISLTIKHFVVSPRPCFMCPPDGMPSGHSMNGAIGAWENSVGSNHGWGFAWDITTPILRVDAKRHTKKQAVLGTMLGAGSDVLGHFIVRCAE